MRRGRRLGLAVLLNVVLLREGRRLRLRWRPHLVWISVRLRLAVRSGRAHAESRRAMMHLVRPNRLVDRVHGRLAHGILGMGLLRVLLWRHHVRLGLLSWHHVLLARSDAGCSWNLR
jgi:hypothetical protein